MRLIVRGTGAEAATHDAMAAALRAEAPDLALDPPETLPAPVSNSTAEPGVRSWLVAALVACYLPARRAMRVAPTEALRAE